MLIYGGRLISPELSLDDPLTKMSLRQLVEFEAYLWTWMKNSPPSIVQILNAIHREVEWRAQDTDWRQTTAR